MGLLPAINTCKFAVNFLAPLYHLINPSLLLFSTKLEVKRSGSSPMATSSTPTTVGLKHINFTLEILWVISCSNSYVWRVVMLLCISKIDIFQETCRMRFEEIERGLHCPLENLTLLLESQNGKKINISKCHYGRD